MIDKEIYKMNFYQGCAVNVLHNQLDKIDWNEKKYCIEEKYDGIWIAIIYDGEKVILKSRTGQEKINGQLFSLKMYIFDYLKSIGCTSLVLTGELAFGSQKGTEYFLKFGHHKVDVFDILFLDGKKLWSLSLEQRKVLLDETLRSADSSFINKAPYKFIEDCCSAEKYYNDIIEKNGEGIVIKDISDNGLYRFGDKSPFWYKVKKEITMDYVFMGIQISKSKNYRKKGYAGGICLGLYVKGELEHKLIVGSMSNEWRREFFLNEKEYFHKVIECKGFELFKSGALRHPSFLRVRDDKLAKECIWGEYE